MQDKIFNHHCIDQFPELDELPLHDQAMDKFRLFFPLPATSARVDPSGKRMHYKLRGTTLMEDYMKKARVVIQIQQLPLTVSRDRRGRIRRQPGDHL
jgi:hypothetical protein